MKEWTLYQIISAPGAAKIDLEKRAREIEVLRKENADLRAGINEIPEMAGVNHGVKTMCQLLLNKGGA